MVEVDFYCGGCIFPLYCYHDKVLALCHGGCFFNFALKGEVFLKGLGQGASWKSGYGQAMPSYGN